MTIFEIAVMSLLMLIAIRQHATNGMVDNIETLTVKNHNKNNL